MEAVSILVGVLVGLALGAVASWLLAAKFREQAVAARVTETQQAHTVALATAQANVISLTEQLRSVTSRSETVQSALSDTRAHYEAQLAEAATRVEHANQNVEEQRVLLAEAEKKLLDAFKALSGEALALNTTKFLELAKTTFEALQKQAEGDLGKKQEAIDLLLKPIGETLTKYEEQLKQLEVKREKAYSSLEQNLKGLGEAQASLQKETTTLSTALRNPTVRGRWGEMTLQRVAELAGMVEHCDFTTQETFNADDGKQRPDMIVRLPSDRLVAVDSKVPLDAYLDALAEGATPEARKAALERHSAAFRAHLNTLTNKAYWKALGATPEFVVMFVPGEPFLSAALENDKTLIEDGAADRVLIATPTTLIATLLAVAHGWRQHQMAENAEEIRALGATLYDRLIKFGEQFAATGTALGRTVDAYNKAVGSYDGRLAVTARKFQDLGIAAKEDLPDVEPVDKAPRRLEVAEAATEGG